MIGLAPGVVSHITLQLLSHQLAHFTSHSSPLSGWSTPSPHEPLGPPGPHFHALAFAAQRACPDASAESQFPTHATASHAMIVLYVAQDPIPLIQLT